MITKAERSDIEGLPSRQPGCPDKTCGVCRANARRGEALEKLLREYDAMNAALARARAVLDTGVQDNAASDVYTVLDHLDRVLA